MRGRELPARYVEAPLTLYAIDARGDVLRGQHQCRFVASAMVSARKYDVFVALVMHGVLILAIRGYSVASPLEAAALEIAIGWARGAKQESAWC